MRLSFRYAPPPGSLRYGGSQLPPPGRCPVCVLLGKTFFQNWGDAATAGAPGSLWFGSFAPLDAQTRSLYVLSHPPGEPESFSRLLAYPCLLGTCKTRPETAGVLLCMCWLSSPFRAAQNPTKNACKLLAFERRRAGSLCAFLSPVRFAMVRFTALNACGSPPQALKCLAMRAQCPRVAFSVHPQGSCMPLARCARPGGAWRVTRRFFCPGMSRFRSAMVRFCSGPVRFTPLALSSRTLSTLRTSSACH